ncbi:MAG TPA: pyridoxamine 5'-phosphate oxidase family protein [Pseudonocardia sp.]|jgi:nitroimidazol reductase NimA-like FMN-containing flavoprotein (pyridoxamine 5'-phosphate oxidase superfamily)|nr:pyridoxamine 5'-phosphate oxidase family protein [Pseudonocardia sp.]
MSTADTETVPFTELDRGTCLRLLGHSAIGRVIFTDAALPAAQPVNFLLDGEEVVFHAATGSKLAAASRRTVVGFQVDRFDPDTRAGWSVLGVGEGYEITDVGRLAVLVARRPPRWAPTHPVHTIAIPLRHLTGRGLSLADDGNSRGVDKARPSAV